MDSIRLWSPSPPPPPARVPFHRGPRPRRAGGVGLRLRGAAPAPPELSFWNGTTRVNAVGEGDPAIVRFTGADPGAAVTLRARVRRYAGLGPLPGGCARDGGREPRSAGGRDLRGRRFRRANLVAARRTHDVRSDRSRRPNRNGRGTPRPRSPRGGGGRGGRPGGVDPARVRAGARPAGRPRRRPGRRPLHAGPDRRTSRRARAGRLRRGRARPLSRRAAHLAARGYAALALAYFGTEHLPPTLAEIPLEYFETALAWLARQPEVDPDRLGVAGVLRGGELALLLGATFPALRAVVADVPSPCAQGRHQSDAEGHLDPRRRPPALPGVRRGGGGRAAAAGGAARRRPRLPPGLGLRSRPSPARRRDHGGRLRNRDRADGRAHLAHRRRRRRSLAVMPLRRRRPGRSCAPRATPIATPTPPSASPTPAALHRPPGAPTTDLYAVPVEGLGAFIHGGKPGPHPRAERERERQMLAFLESALR